MWDVGSHRRRINRPAELRNSIIQREITPQKGNVNNSGYYDFKELSAARRTEWDYDLFNIWINSQSVSLHRRVWPSTYPLPAWARREERDYSLSYRPRLHVGLGASSLAEQKKTIWWAPSLGVWLLWATAQHSECSLLLSSQDNWRRRV